MLGPGLEDVVGFFSCITSSHADVRLSVALPFLEVTNDFLVCIELSDSCWELSVPIDISVDSWVIEGYEADRDEVVKGVVLPQLRKVISGVDIWVLGDANAWGGDEFSPEDGLVFARRSFDPWLAILEHKAKVG